MFWWEILLQRGLEEGNRGFVGDIGKEWGFIFSPPSIGRYTLHIDLIILFVELLLIILLGWFLNIIINKPRN